MRDQLQAALRPGVEHNNVVTIYIHILPTSYTITLHSDCVATL